MPKGYYKRCKRFKSDPKFVKRNLVNADLENGKYALKNSLSSNFSFMKWRKNRVYGNFLEVEI